MRAISWLAATRLASQEGLCSMEWVSKVLNISGHKIVKRLSSVSTATAKSGRPQIQRWSRYGNSCDTMYDNPRHGLVSTGNRKKTCISKKNAWIFAWTVWTSNLVAEQTALNCLCYICKQIKRNAGIVKIFSDRLSCYLSLIRQSKFDYWKAGRNSACRHFPSWHSSDSIPCLYRHNIPFSGLGPSSLLSSLETENSSV
jgi:hypothetical protein